MSTGQNLDVARPEHVARFYVTSRIKIGERLCALARGQRCGTGKCVAARQRSRASSSDHEQALSSRFPVAHCCSICADTLALQVYHSVVSEAATLAASIPSDSTE
jgi:hypothetical protein